MRIAVLSDVHANLEALTTALERVDALGAEHVVCLGDVVGYGPSPAEVLDLVRARADLVVLGNHDAAVATGEAIDMLPKDGQVAARTHREMLSADDLDWLAGLPLTAERFGATFAHAGPARPELWPRIETFGDARAQFEAFETDLCFIGHSHKPAVLSETLGVFRVRPGHRFLIDVGSVGQPRDHDPRLSFALWDTEAGTVEHVRAHYDHALTVARVAKLGLPASLGDRLRAGV